MKKSIFNRKKKKESEKNKNPWTRKVEVKKVEDPTSFKFFVKGTFKNFNLKYSRFGGRKFHISFLLRIKRIIAATFFFIFFIAALISYPNILCLLFFGSAYLHLDYVWKTRRFKWKVKENEE